MRGFPELQVTGSRSETSDKDALQKHEANGVRDGDGAATVSGPRNLSSAEKSAE
jgi:hypothetical protein